MRHEHARGFPPDLACLPPRTCRASARFCWRSCACSTWRAGPVRWSAPGRSSSSRRRRCRRTSAIATACSTSWSTMPSRRQASARGARVRAFAILDGRAHDAGEATHGRQRPRDAEAAAPRRALDRRGGGGPCARIADGRDRLGRAEARPRARRRARARRGREDRAGRAIGVGRDRGARHRSVPDRRAHRRRRPRSRSVASAKGPTR